MSNAYFPRAMRWGAMGLLLMAAGGAYADPPSTQPAGVFLWWEAEQPKATNFPDRHDFNPANEKEADALSAGKWIGASGKWDKTLFLEYEITVPQGGEYNFYVRKFWKHGPFKWHFDDQPWAECAKDVNLMDSVTLRRLVGVNWVSLGTVQLKAGPHTLRIELLKNEGAACFDCFVLSSTPFHPRGRLQPGEKYGRKVAGWFEFDPPADDFRPTPLDLSYLNHKIAGEFGWAKAQGKDVVFEKENQPVRFWGVTVGDETFMMEKPAVDYLARRLAKMGVNLVRMHVDFDDDQPNERLNRIQYFVSAMKKQGIYSYIGFYCTAVARVREKWNVPELKTGSSIQTLLFYYPPIQKCYQGWVRCLFGTVNPYTGVSLAKDPALLGIELMDEDNFFFWTFKPSNLPPVALAYLEKAFGVWLKNKYGALDKAQAAWGAEKPPKDGKDDGEAGRIVFYDSGSLTGADWAAAARNSKRAADQAQFLTEHLRNFWGTTGKWIKTELGFGGLIVPTNWKTADERVLGPLDKYCLTAGDATAENDYFGPNPKGEPFAFPYAEGYWYRDVCTVREPINPILMQARFVDVPHFWTEGIWQFPSRFRAEMPLILAGYFSLQGVNGFMLFVLERDWPAMLHGLWPVQSPAVMGQFPAAALIYRKGYIQEGPLAVHEALKLSDLYQLKGSAIGKPAGLDQAQAAHVPTGANVDLSSSGGIDPLSFLVGRVARTIGENPGASSVLPELPKLIDREGKKVTSATGELVLNWGQGVMTMNAPCAQGAVGFLQGAGAIKLKDVTLQSANEFGSAVVVSLDGKPLRESARMLLQVMSEEKNFGWKTKLEKKKQGDKEVEVEVIESIGSPPILVKNLAGTVSLTRPDAAALKVTALDINGYPVKETGHGDPITLLPETMYYLIEK